MLEKFNKLISEYMQGAAIALDIDEDKPIVISGIKGMKSTDFKKKFKNYAAYLKWSDSDDAGNYSVQYIENV